MCIVSNLSHEMFTYYVHIVVQSCPWYNSVFGLVYSKYIIMNIKQRKLLNCVKGKIEPQHTYYINTWHFPVQFALNTWSLRLHAFHASLTKWLSPDFEKKKTKKTLIPFICKYCYIHIYQVVNVMYLCSCQCTKPKCNNSNCI